MSYQAQQGPPPILSIRHFALEVWLAGVDATGEFILLVIKVRTGRGIGVVGVGGVICLALVHDSW